MISLFYNEIIDDDKGTIGGYIKGNSLPFEAPRKLNINDHKTIQKNCEDTLLPNLKKDTYPYIVASIKYLLANDTSLPEGTPIGYKDSFNKKRILDANNFSMSELITNCIYYCLNIDNYDQSKVINRDFFKKQEIIDYAKEITFNDDFSKVINSKLESSSIGDKFNMTFHKVNSTSSLLIPNTSKITLYTLAFKDKDFSLEELIDLLNENLSCYTFSRLEQSTSDNSFIIKQFKKAFKRVEAYYGSDKLNELIDNMLIYLFLENSLGAPKLFSNVELSKALYPEYPLIDLGVHFLNTDKDIQLIFSIAKLSNILRESVDFTLDKVADIIKRDATLLNLLDKSTLRQSFDDGITEYLIETILPNEDTKNKPNTSFGICIGYSIDKQELLNLETNDFKKEIENKFLNDANNIIDYINDKINSDSILKNYSYYLYLIPLFDVDKTKNIIIKEIGG